MKHLYRLLPVALLSLLAACSPSGDSGAGDAAPPAATEPAAATGSGAQDAIGEAMDEAQETRVAIAKLVKEDGDWFLYVQGPRHSVAEIIPPRIRRDYRLIESQSDAPPWCDGKGHSIRCIGVYFDPWEEA